MRPLIQIASPVLFQPPCQPAMRREPSVEKSTGGFSISEGRYRAPRGGSLLERGPGQGRFAQSRNSTLPSPPVIGLSVVAWMAQPCPSSHDATRSSAA